MENIDANRLARICAYSADAREWAQFVSAISPVVALAARRMSAVWGDSLSSTVSEIVQEVFVRLCEEDRRVLREFEDRGNDSFLRLLRVITASVATDYFRRIHAEKRGGRNSNVPLDSYSDIQDFSRCADTEAVEKAALIAQLDGLLRKNAARITERDRSLFWLYYRQGLTADAISRIPAIGLSAKGVESALLRITRILRETVLQTQQLRKNPKIISQPILKRKGFSPVVAIDNMKHQ